MMNYPITDHEKFMMGKMGNYPARYVETSSPVTLDFQPKTLYFEIDDTENYGILKVARTGSGSPSPICANSGQCICRGL